jgi:hypothetical protein
MKTNGTRFVFFAVLAELLFLLISFTAAAQPDYKFRNGTLVSGTDKKEGAKYRFNNVRPGTDAFVTITKIDKVTLSQFDGPSGFDEAFQPYIKCPAKTKGYVEFRFDFLIAGTILPNLMLEVPVTAIDIDGYIYPDEKVYEFDEFDNGLTNLVLWDLVGTALKVNYKGNEVEALNKTAIDYPGIDTVQRDVMFTMIYTAVTSITIRAGVDNRSNTAVERLRSDYFKRFAYAGSQLAKPALVTFTGLEKSKKVELQWTLDRDNTLSKVVVEKGTSPSQFNAIGEVWMGNATDKTNFNYSDIAGVSNVAYYRLKMITADGNVTYSNILTFRSAEGGGQPFRVYPSVVNSSVTVAVKGDKTGAATFQLLDYAGRVVKQQNIIVQEGNNNVVVNDLGNINTGNYVVSLKTSDNQVHTQKIFKQ